MERLFISGNRRYFVTENNQPFFWLGDTAWELFHKMTREEGLYYLKDRITLGFNVVQAALLAESDDFQNGNAYGRCPFRKDSGSGGYTGLVPDTGNGYGYWEHVNYLVQEAQKMGIYMALLPAWGDKINKMGGCGPEAINEYNAGKYGKWLGSRYGGCENIIWILGGDRPLTQVGHFRTVEAMAKGLKDSGGKQLISFHPYGGLSSSYHLGMEEWMDFNMIQSGHGKRHIANYEQVEADYSRKPVKPVLDGEPCYEDHPVGFCPDNGYFDASDVRRAAYWAVFAGACGHTYGHHCIWNVNREAGGYYIMKWQDALDRPGARQMVHLKELLESVDYQNGWPDEELPETNYGGANHMQAFRGRDYALVYIPCGLPFNVNMGRLGWEHARVRWFDPRSGEWREKDECPCREITHFLPPTAGRGGDWVLVLTRV